MSDMQLTSLLINCDVNPDSTFNPSLGPLSVEIVPEEGDSIEFALSSGYRQHKVEVFPGRYAVIARRPNGEHLRRMVTVSEGRSATVRLADAVPPSPNEFMVPETARGEITRGPEYRFGESIGALKGFLGNTLRSVNTTAKRNVNEVVERQLTLRVWAQNSDREPTVQWRQGSSFLKLVLTKDHFAVGLLDEHGFGPIVMVPPFRDPLEVTFLAEGIASWAGARYLNPSGQRAPVALATPEEPHIADLLAALGAPSVEQTAAIWEQNWNSLQYIDGPLDSYPGEALLGAHYLLRFLPDKLPLQWADNLGRILPTAADGPVIAAWLRILSTSADVRALSPDIVSKDVQQLLADALTRPKTLFARTRILLANGLRLQPPMTNLSPQVITNQASPNDFLNYGAHAGGLEAFWGADPSSPGPPNSQVKTLSGIYIATFTLRGTTFGSDK